MGEAWVYSRYYVTNCFSFFGAFFIKKIELIQEDIDNIVVIQPELDS